jgi:hypothetical protein
MSVWRKPGPGWDVIPGSGRIRTVDAGALERATSVEKSRRRNFTYGAVSVTSPLTERPESPMSDAAQRRSRSGMNGVLGTTATWSRTLRRASLPPLPREPNAPSTRFGSGRCDSSRRRAARRGASRASSVCPSAQPSHRDAPARTCGGLQLDVRTGPRHAQHRRLGAGQAAPIARCVALRCFTDTTLGGPPMLRRTSARRVAQCRASPPIPPRPRSGSQLQ